MTKIGRKPHCQVLTHGKICGWLVELPWNIENKCVKCNTCSGSVQNIWKKTALVLGRMSWKECGTSRASGECAQIYELLNVRNMWNKHVKCNTYPGSVWNIWKKQSWDIIWKGFVAVDFIGWVGGCVGCVLTLFCWQMAHPATYSYIWSDVILATSNNVGPFLGWYPFLDFLSLVNHEFLVQLVFVFHYYQGYSIVLDRKVFHFLFSNWKDLIWLVEFLL